MELKDTFSRYFHKKKLISLYSNVFDQKKGKKGYKNMDLTAVLKIFSFVFDFLYSLEELASSHPVILHLEDF
jgi:hypothetical protein